MKKCCLVAIGSLFSFLAFAGGEISFENVEFDFEKVQIGKPVHHCFVFRNVGDEPLLVKDVRSSCGCVYASWTASPVAVGDTGSVCVYYKNNVTGTFHKTVKVISNSSRLKKKLPLVLKGETVRKKN